jgi:hypothetical protein
VPAVLGVIGSILGRARPATTVLLVVLVLAAVVAPVDQARIHELPSLDKNIGFGLPFAALGTGYALSTVRAWLSRRRPRGELTAIVAIVALVLITLVAGRVQKVQFRGPGITVAQQIVTTLRHDYAGGTFILADGAARMEQYYLPAIPPERWIATFAPTRQQGARIASQICSGDISVVILRRSGQAYDHPYDRTIVRLLGSSRRYRLATVAGQGQFSTQVWTLRRPGPLPGGCL